MTMAAVAFVIAAPAVQTQQPRLPYVIVGTGQTRCYDSSREINPPRPGQPFYGQDAQYPGPLASYQISRDGLTAYDSNTGLTWQRSPDLRGALPQTGEKLTLQQAQALPANLNAARFGGFGDWRLPGIKELYSLIQFSGIDPSGPANMDSSRLTPFIDTRAFKFAYGDTRAGERMIDSQWASATVYAANRTQMFGVNFADGRIKGYGTAIRGRPAKTFYTLCVRGNPAYGHNDLHDNADGTISDRATGLMWTKADSGKGMNWEAALAWVQARNAKRYLGHNDWRLPNAKELQSIVDYTRCPDVTRSAAIDPLFICTAITNEIGKADYPYYWTGTTHASIVGAGNAVYVAFGRAAGWPTGHEGHPGSFGPPSGGPPRLDSGAPPYADVHGAGAQRSDPKTGNPAAFPHGRGPQGDVVRIYNFVRCVRTY
jgi:hypothetical protein